MNTYAVGVEIACNGVGEPYGQAQIDAAFAASIAVIQGCGLASSDLSTHQTYAPDRKIDPATNTAVQGPWQPGSCTSSGTWELTDLVAEHQRRAGTIPTPRPPTPTPDDEDDDMMFDGFWQRDNDHPIFAIYKNATKQWIQNEADLNATAALWSVRGAPAEALGVRIQTDPSMFTAFGLVVGPMPNDGVARDEYGNRV
jgi:hypothetical protein